MTTPQNVKAIIDSGGGRLVGKTRLQKSAYLLEAAGVGYGFDFSYHYYGPYSDELASAAADAKALGLIRVNEESSQAGLTYAVYESQLGAGREDGMSARRREILELLDAYDVVTLELAATAHFLGQNGYENDPWAETRRRKSVKATAQRIENAERLLLALGLVSQAAAA